MLDFSLPPAVAIALALGIAMPGFLLITTRMPKLVGRNASQFLMAVVLMFGSWIAAVFLLAGELSMSLLDMLVGLSILASAALFYLEVWALLSRGYTLGLLLTLLSAKQPLTEQDLARRYRGGDGLDWIMRHRLSGLAAVRLVVIGGGVVCLTVTGFIMARLYKLSIALLGLRKTG